MPNILDQHLEQRKLRLRESNIEIKTTFYLAFQFKFYPSKIYYRT